MGIRVLNSSLDYEGKKREDDKITGKYFENDESPVHCFAAEDTSRAHLPIINRTDSFSMISAHKVLIHRKDGEEYLEGQCFARMRISTIVYHHGETVQLQEKAKVKEGSGTACDKHCSLDQETAITDRDVIPRFSANKSIVRC